MWHISKKILHMCSFCSLTPVAIVNQELILVRMEVIVSSGMSLNYLYVGKSK